MTRRHRDADGMDHHQKVSMQLSSNVASIGNKGVELSQDSKPTGLFCAVEDP